MFNNVNNTYTMFTNVNNTYTMFNNVNNTYTMFNNVKKYLYYVYIMLTIPILCLIM